ncbi:type II toxin-antitoxin system RelE/ParE family toxin [Candidatus Azambacteria bacterium]|nr:type II toxin-antitoxin system RelE/ParE family toxin [Candidatus Azambacteria bacterium]
MKHQVVLTPKAEKELKKIPQEHYKNIISSLVSLSDDPYGGKKLKGDYKKCYSLRVWPYRIIYQIYKSKLIIIVISIGHRQKVYKR